MAAVSLNEVDVKLISDVLGYLNFSSGNLPTSLFSAWNLLFESFHSKGSREIWKDVLDSLKSELDRLSTESSIFADSRQAKSALVAFEPVLVHYRRFHEDSLFKLKNSYLFNPFFLARVCSVLVQQYQTNPTSSEDDKIVLQLSDFLGYRPIPVLEGGEKHEPNPREWIAPIPLYVKDVGCSFGQYRRILEYAMQIFRETDPDLLFEASFDLEKLQELAVDPRPYDFDHPVNRRLNYSFGTWDERSVDQDGYFQRFVVHRTILDAIASRVWQETDEGLRAEYEYEAGAVLAGTILMGSEICGGRVQAYDSSTSLFELSQRIALVRDQFYERLLKKAPLSIRSRLNEEAARLFQPFGGARQTLNRKLAAQRSDQTQRFALARTYARMGYFEASRLQAEKIETLSARFLSQIDCRLTKAHLLADDGKIEEASKYLPEIEDLMRRGLACGAFPDPWFILGFDAEFSLFPSPDESVHDHRLDGFIDLLNDVFDLYSRLLKEAAAGQNDDLKASLSEQMSELAAWWDQFGSTEVTSVEGFSGQEVFDSAVKVAAALAAWSSAEGAVGDVAFWKRHIERFKSPKAFVLLGRALLDKSDFISTTSLLIYWLDQAPTIALVEADYSFYELALLCLDELWTQRVDSEQNASPRRRTQSRASMLTLDEFLTRWHLTTKFIDSLEANADEYWEAPRLDVDPSRFDKKLAFKTENPVLADFARRMILSTKPSEPGANKSTKVTVKASMRDAARVFDSDNIPSFEEFERFYNENAELFPKYLTFERFIEILLQTTTLSQKTRNRMYALLRGKRNKTITVDDPFLRSIEDADAWQNLLNELGISEDSPLTELVRREIDAKGGASRDESIEFVQGDDLEDDYDDESEEELDDDGITGGDPTFSAAYDNMTYRDSADDGVEDDTAPGGGSSRRFEDDSETNEFSKETDRVADRLMFLSTIAKLWKIAVSHSPLLNYQTDAEFDESTLKRAREILENWLSQAEQFGTNLYELLDQTTRFRVPKPSGSSESLVEYDQLRGAKELLLDRIVWTIVEVEDAVALMKAALRVEDVPSYEKKWKTTALKTLSAVFRRDSKLVRKLWPTLLEQIGKETLLYIPTARGGDAKSIVESRRLQQIVLRLLGCVPHLGLLKETLELVECTRKMEQIRLSAPGSVTEFDRLVETALRGITSELAESSKHWCANDSNAAESNAKLVYFLTNALEIALRSWLKHTKQIRISTAEGLDGRWWSSVKEFVISYGEDLFKQNFLAFRNIRAILHQGADSYLAALFELKKNGEELEVGETLISALESGEIDLGVAAGTLDAILECVAENYTEYVDYNSTTTQSDHGSKLYMLLDFLRLLAKYERVAWSIKPYYWTHDALIRAGYGESAENWLGFVRTNTEAPAANFLNQYDNLRREYGIWLQSVYERLQERFTRPLETAQMCGLVDDAITKARTEGEDNAVFKSLNEMVERFASEPTGVGFELPDWLDELQNEVVEAGVDSEESARQRPAMDRGIEADSFPMTPIEIEDIESQLSTLLSDDSTSID